MSRLRTNIITNRMANGAPTVSNGLVISGVTTTSEVFIGSNIKLDPVSGIVTATSFDGGLPITNGANNRIITASSASVIQGESNLTFDGSSLDIFNGSNSSTIKLKRHATTASEQAHIGYFSSGLHIETRENTNIELKSNTQTKLLVNPSGAVVSGVCTATTFKGDGSNLTGISAGISMMDMWRITNDNNITGDADIDSYWERADTFFAQIGSGMSESSGVFTFPQTGIYLIMVQAATYGNGHSYAGFFTQVSTNSGGSYSNFTYCYGNHRGGSGYNNLFVNGILDVTDESTFRIKMRGHTPGNLQFSGDTNAHRTGITFIRIGDT